MNNRMHHGTNDNHKELFYGKSVVQTFNNWLDISMMRSQDKSNQLQQQLNIRKEYVLNNTGDLLPNIDRGEVFNIPFLRQQVKNCYDRGCDLNQDRINQTQYLVDSYGSEYFEAHPDATESEMEEYVTSGCNVLRNIETTINQLDLMETTLQEMMWDCRYQPVFPPIQNCKLQ